MPQAWFVHRDGGPIGPFASGELQRMAHEGTVTPSTLVSRDRKVWLMAERVRGLDFTAGTASDGGSSRTFPPKSDARISLFNVDKRVGV